MEVFQFLTLRGKIHIPSMRPRNPFAPGVLEQINTLPTNQQAEGISNALKVSNVGGVLDVLGVNSQYDVVLYNLTLQQT